MIQFYTSILLVLLAVIDQVASTDHHAPSTSPAKDEQARSYIDPLDASPSDSSTLTTRSHKILVSGWPSTSPMWPSIQMAQKQIDNSAPTHWYDMIEPFIYADKPRSNDYSLLLTINKTISSTLRNHSKPIEIDLSFEYYFSYDQKTTAPPGMRIEVDRKQLRYLEPDGQLIRPNLWNKLNEKLQIAELARLDNPDWLKISLVNRQMPSLVALRRLRVEFILDLNAKSHDVPHAPATMLNKQGDVASNPQPNPTNNIAQDQSQSNAAPQQPQIQPTDPASEPQTPPQPAPVQPLLPPAAQEPLAPTQPVEQLSPRPPPVRNQPQEFGTRPGDIQQPEPPQYEQPAPGRLPEVEENRYPTSQNQPGSVDYDNVPASSNSIGNKVKPGEEEKKSRWNIWGKGRRKRDTESISRNTTTSIVLTCFQAEDCHWKTESSEQIQWSLARMPPSTEIVKLGYYYVSNRNNYGDSSRMLNIWLNRTDSATIADQNSDHCIDFAFYVTEGSRLSLFQLKKGVARSEDEQWTKGSRLLTWSPTMASPDPYNKSISIRNSVPKSKLAAMNDERNGWTAETLCFGDFFNDDCAGLCAFGFEMTSESANRQQDSTGHQSVSESGYIDTKLEQAGEIISDQQTKYDEQVVGVAILQEYTTNIPLKRQKLNWLDTWQRDQVTPSDNWKFYPKLDYQFMADNVTFMNMFDRAHYYMQSDWLNVDQHSNFTASLTIEPVASNETLARLPDIYDQSFNSLNTMTQTGNALGHDQADDIYVFGLSLTMNLVDGNFNQIYSNSTTHHWSLRTNETQILDLSLPVTDSIQAARNGQLQRELDSSLYKLILEFVFDAHWLKPNSTLEKILTDNNLAYRLTLANVTLSDRCYPNPCQHGLCQQNGTGFEDWTCLCDEQHRGRRCEFGRWCNLPHILPWNPSQRNGNGNILKTSQLQQRQPKLDASINRITGKEYCQRKLGAGSKCTDIDLPLNEIIYTEEDRTFFCTCQDDYYLSDDSKCKSAHLCNSVVCPSIGMVCDESRAFNKTQPCHCDEKQDWFPETIEGSTKCVRRQCQDKQRDCQFNAHICLPTLPGEKPICKCGPKFTLKVNEKGQKYCQSTACVLPTLNDCQQICVPDNSNLVKPYTCACHPGYMLESDGRSCKPQRAQLLPHCKPSCNSDTQICTDAGCKCKQGFVGEGEVRVQLVPKNKQISNTTIDYTQSIKCLNVCSLTYAENKEEFERIESVCPLGLCDPTNFQCRCSDPSSSALINTKYEPIYGNSSSPQRNSPLCHLKRVCEPESSGYKICRSRGAICVPDYTKPAMFDCICPPSTDKRRYGQETVSEFTCEPKCSTKKSECLRRQAVCKLVDRDEVRCECLPGLMFDQHDQKCYLAKYSYSFNIVVVNRYYEPEAKFHKLELLNATSDTTSDKAHLFDVKNHSLDPTSHIPVDRPNINEILPQFSNNDHDNQIPTNQQPIAWKSIFITEYNQCNITQVIPKSVIDDPYEHDIESYLGYIDQCNEKIHQNVRTYHLNSKLSEDLRQSLRQHLRDFTVTTNNSSCLELEPDGMYLNCTVYLQSNEPIQMSLVDYVFNDCDKHGQDERYCWIKPRLLLKKDAQVSTNQPPDTTSTKHTSGSLNFRQIIPCEINNFCGLDAYSVRNDDKTSQCSCKCPLDIETVDVKDLEPKNENEATRISVKEICAPRNHCGANSTYCLGKTGTSCQYDIRTGSRCTCVYPSYENAEGQCVEITFTTLDSTLIVIIIMLGTGLIVSIAINLAMVAKSKSVFGRSKQYPLNEFSTTRPTNRSTGVPNPVFSND